MYSLIYYELSKFLPDELISLILFKYGGLKHPIMTDSCFNEKKEAKAIEGELIYHIWNERKKNNFDESAFRCLIHLGSLRFVQNRTDQICNNSHVKKKEQYYIFLEKYGLIHYFNYTWLFPMNCSNDILIKEVSKNIEPSKIQDYQLENLTRKELVNLYFKL